MVHKSFTDKDIDIQEVINLLALNLPEQSTLRNSLETVGNGHWESKAYFRIVDSTNANKLEAEWQFKENVIFEHPKLGTIVLDILKDNQLGGIEFVKLI